MSSKIQIRRGLKASLPTLSSGELGFATDSNELYIGGTSGNVKVAVPSTAALTLYVSTTGSDTNDGLTSGAALRTIQAAIAKIPQIINHAVTINVAAGAYPENLLIEGFVGSGSISIIGSSASTTSTFSAKFTGSSVYCTIQGFAFTATDRDAVYITRSNVEVGSCNLIISASFAGVKAINNGQAYVHDCSISSHLTGILASTTSEILSNNNTGSSNTTGLYASGGVIRKLSTQPAGTTAELVQSGGQIL